MRIKIFKYIIIYFILICLATFTSISNDRKITALWDVTGDTLTLDSVQYTTISSIAIDNESKYFDGTYLSNPTHSVKNFSVFSYNGSIINSGEISPSERKKLLTYPGLNFVYIDGILFKLVNDGISEYHTVSNLSNLNDDTLAIAYKAGYKPSTVSLKENQNAIVFNMERDSSLNRENVKSFRVYASINNVKYENSVKPVNGIQRIDTTNSQLAISALFNISKDDFRYSLMYQQFNDSVDIKTYYSDSQNSYVRETYLSFLIIDDTLEKFGVSYSNRTLSGNSNSRSQSISSSVLNILRVDKNTIYYGIESKGKSNISASDQSSQFSMGEFYKSKLLEITDESEWQISLEAKCE